MGMNARIMGLMAASLALGACASIKDHRGYIVDAALVNSVLPGVDNRVSVERALGRPSYVSEFGRKDWFYISTNTRQAPFRRARANEQLAVRVVFDEQGKVVSVDRTGMDQVVKIDPDGHKTPTLGKNRTFIEDLFGNIGQVGAPGAGTGGGPGGPNGS